MLLKSLTVNLLVVGFAAWAVGYYADHWFSSISQAIMGLASLNIGFMLKSLERQKKFWW